MPASKGGLFAEESSDSAVKYAHAAAACMSGFIAGSTAASIVQPLDVIRTRIQLSAAVGVRMNAKQAFDGVIRDGAQAGVGTLPTLWRGVRPAMARLGTGNATYFLWLQLWRKVFAKRDESGQAVLGPAGSFYAGGMSGLCTSIVLTPFTVVKTRAEGWVGSSQGVFSSMRSIVQSEGFPGLFRGLVPTMATIGPFAALFLTFYTQTRKRLNERFGDRMPPVALAFASGCVAATGATLVTQPMDVLRTRAQAGLQGSAVGVLAAASGIIAKEGVRGLFSGFAPRVTKRGLQTALVFSIFEEVRPRVDGAVVRAVRSVRALN